MYFYYAINCFHTIISGYLEIISLKKNPNIFCLLNNTDQHVGYSFCKHMNPVAVCLYLCNCNTCLPSVVVIIMDYNFNPANTQVLSISIELHCVYFCIFDLFTFPSHSVIPNCETKQGGQHSHEKYLYLYFHSLKCVIVLREHKIEM